MSLNELYTRYVNEYNTWAKAIGARIQAELYEEYFTITVKRPGKVIPALKVHAKLWGEDQIKITQIKGLSKNTVYVNRDIRFYSFMFVRGRLLQGSALLYL